MRKFWEIFKTANKALLLHKARTILTMLGVIIGVFAVVSLVSMGIGVQNYIEDQFEAIGANLIIVAPGKVNFADDPAKVFGNIKIEEKHVDLIEKYAGDHIRFVTPSKRFGGNIEYKTNSYYGTVIGGNEHMLEIFGADLSEGRFYNEAEAKSGSDVAIIGYEVAEELFPNTNPVGKKVHVNEGSYEIIGYTTKKGPDYDGNIYIPLKKVKEDFDASELTAIYILAKDNDNVDLAMKQVEYALLRDLKEDEFSVISAEDILESIQSILSIMTAAITAIAAISLLVGGIGIMNIMLVSVTERIKEIGLRKALGATPNVIAFQFLFESVLISVGGGAIGLFLGWVASLAARSVIRTEVPAWTILLAVGFSVFVGIVFGTYPAIKASKKDPIEALRFE